MDDGETAPPAAQRRRIQKEKTTNIPHKLVMLILARLPVESLLRLRSVCKAWQSTISLDASFHRAHQNPLLLVAPQTLRDGKEHTDTVILYRWEDSQQGAALPVVHAIDVSSEEIMHGLAHCDGLILLPSESAVRVLNPATRRTVALPWSPGATRPPSGPRPRASLYHQSFGFGHDPRSGACKVARFFYRSMHVSGTPGKSCYTTGMEVFTIGTDQHWRETANDLPYPVVTRHTATFFKGSLLWTIDEHKLGHVPPGFLRFSLEDEAFGVMPPPPCNRRLYYVWCPLAELRGELCLAVGGADINTIELWMCDNAENPQWDLRYTINATSYMPPDFNPVAIFDDEIVFKEWYFETRRYNLGTKSYTDAFHMKDLQYHNPITGMLGYQGRHFAYFDVIPYIPSLVQI